MEEVRLFKYEFAGIHPILFGSQFVGLNQRLRTDTLQHLPIPLRLATWEVDGIRSEVLDLERIVFLR